MVLAYAVMSVPESVLMEALSCSFVPMGTACSTTTSLSFLSAGNRYAHYFKNVYSKHDAYQNNPLNHRKLSLSFAQFAPIPVSGLFPLSVKSHFVLERPRGLLNHASHFGCLGPWSQ